MHETLLCNLLVTFLHQVFKALCELPMYGDKMSVRSKRIPGLKLGLGTFVNSDIDAKQRVVYYGLHAVGVADVSHQFTQGQTRMATIECIILTPSIYAAKASGSVMYYNGTISGGTVTIRLKPKTAAANTNNNLGGVHFWMVGTPDVNRIFV
jgi:hypothetical protein